MLAAEHAIKQKDLAEVEQGCEDLKDPGQDLVWLWLYQQLRTMSLDRLSPSRMC